jgi:SAM-dependent methyltransferase
MPYYIIRGGSAGRERLRVLSRVMHGATTSLLDRVGTHAGWSYLDAGCGGGDVTIELARRAGPSGLVVGEDIDEVKLALARRESSEQGFPAIEFRYANVYDRPQQVNVHTELRFDFIYVRFLLTHLPDPSTALVRLAARLRPGGVLVVEDIDFSGHVCQPAQPAFQRYHDLHIESMRRRGGDALIGPKLPGMLQAAGLSAVEVHIAQPIGTDGEAKLIPAITMENIAETVLADGLCSKSELEQIIEQLHQIAQDGSTLTGMPRIFQTWGYAAV